MRQVLQIVIPLLLPTVAYFLYLAVARRGAAAGNSPPPVPWVWLGVAGAVLLVVSLSAFALMGGAPPGSHYEPAKLIDGKIEPGHFSN
jgi:hypothetical protein